MWFDNPNPTLNEPHNDIHEFLMATLEIIGGCSWELQCTCRLTSNKETIKNRTSYSRQPPKGRPVN